MLDFVVVWLAANIARALAIDNLQIPQVNHDVNSMVNEYQQYASYAGPTGSAKAEAAETTPQVKFAPAVTQDTCAPYWLENISHQGVSAFNVDPTAYRVFRNVKDFGAKGDGMTDDTAAINSAISSGNRCVPGSCQGSTTTPAVVYFPAGTYLLSSSIVDYYYTQLIGNPNCPPTLMPIATFTGFGTIDGNPYQPNGNTSYGSTNVFFRQIRNFIFDLRKIPATSSALAIHWPTAQATSIQNCVFHMSDAPGTQHQAIFIENGSGGFMNDLTFNGGLNGLAVGNQQFTMRGLTFNNCVTGITQIWDWGWTYKSLTFNNCTTAINMTAGGTAAQSVGSITLLDSAINNAHVGIATAFDSTSQPPTAGSLIIENVALNNVAIAILGPGGTVLAGGTTTIAGFGEGHSYTPHGPTAIEGPITPFTRPAALLTNGAYYEASKPLYATTPLSSISSVRSGGAKGDGKTDDTASLQTTINAAAAANQIVFFDAGTYKVTRTLTIPPNSKLVGESYSVIMSSGDFFNDQSNPQPVVKVGNTGDVGYIEWSDMIVSTQGTQAGAVLIEWNLASSAGAFAGMWDVHTRIGGFAGSNLQLAQCPTTPSASTTGPINSACIAAYQAFHMTPSASGLYLENVWLWTADHDIEDPANTQISIYTGRGLLLASTAGTALLYGTAVEHYALYQYQFAHTQNVFAGQIQTETPYYQPNPNAAHSGFAATNTALNDPDFATLCSKPSGNCDAFGLRVLDAKGVRIYGAGLYSFFDNYSTNCSAVGNGEACQAEIFSVEGASEVEVYNLNTVGSTSMVEVGGSSVAAYKDNVNVFPDTIALFTSS